MPTDTKKHFAGEATVCSACAEMVVYLQHERTGTLAPITMATYDNGNAVELPGNKYRVLGPKNATLARDAGHKLRLNHFVNCPHRDRFKKRDYQ